jgi:SAM-dependent methyltransferase
MFELEGRLWWYRGLRELLLTTLAPVIASMGRRKPIILDAGCGTGGNLAAFPSDTIRIGIDVAWDGLSLARKRNVPALVRGRVQELPVRDASVDVVLSIDVLYHRWIEDDEAVLREYFRVLAPGGWLVVHVAALEWLRGSHDEVVMTRHRYTRRELVSKVQSAGFQVDRASYRNTFLLPLMLLRRLTSRKGHEPASDLALPPAWLNSLLLSCLRIENILLRVLSFPLGGSLLVLAQKPVSERSSRS